MGIYSNDYRSRNFAVGLTDDRGPAWWANSENLRGLHFPQGIPLSVADDMLNWEPVQVPMLYTDPVSGLARPYGAVSDDGTYAGPMVVTNSRTGEPVGFNGGRTELGGYWPWFIGGASTLLDTPSNDLVLGFIGLFQDGGLAAVQIELAKSIHSAATGIDFRPFVWFAMALNGSMVPKVGRGHTRMVCENTFGAGMSESKNSGMIWSPGKQTKNMRVDWNDARAVLDIVHSDADSLDAEFRTMCETEVSPRQWSQFLDTWVPIERDGKALEGRSLTMATNKRDSLAQLWATDVRVAPWAGTVFGVSQAVTTYGQHMSIVRNTSRVERNKLNMISGKSSGEEREALTVLRQVLASA